MPLLETALPDLLYRGKVRDTYDLGNGLLLMVATDRISAFDVVLPTGIPDKGRILALMSKFWFGRTQHIVPNHFVGMADDPGAIGELAAHPRIASLPEEIARQAMVVRRAERIDVECVVRAYLAGSALMEYERSGTLFGQAVPVGMRDGEMLPELAFTPTTKAEEGHDQNMTSRQVVDMVGTSLARQLEETSKAIYRFAHDFTRDRDVILADTKLEFGLIGEELTLIDELLTPDSSRFWDAAGYKPGRSQPSFDKQFVRDWLTEQGWNQSPPAPELAPDIVEKTGQRYLEAYQRLTGTTL